MEQNVLITYFLVWLVCILLAGLLGYFQYLDKKKLQKQLSQKRAKRHNVQTQLEAVEQVILRNKLTGESNTKSLALQIVSELNNI
jgi:hypothetical protein